MLSKLCLFLSTQKNFFDYLHQNLAKSVFFWLSCATLCSKSEVMLLCLMHNAMGWKKFIRYCRVHQGQLGGKCCVNFLGEVTLSIKKEIKMQLQKKTLSHFVLHAIFRRKTCKVIKIRHSISYLIWFAWIANSSVRK